MNPITLQVVLHGLVALVPVQSSTGPNHLTALLLDARHPAAHECIAPHQPELRFRAASSGECSKAGCHSSGDTCSCEEKALAGKEISLEIPATATPTTKGLDGAQPPPLPATAADAISTGYLSNFSQPPLRSKLNPSFLAPKPPSNLLVRMDVPFDSVAACALWGREDDGEKNIHAMNFRPLATAGAAAETNQAIAQMVIATLSLPDAEAAKKGVIIHLRAFGSEIDTPITVKPGKGFRIDLSNDTPSGLERDAPCDDGVARHFALFYELTLNPPAWKDRLVPHLKFTHFRKEKGVVNQACVLGDLNPTDRPACPMSVFHLP